MLNAKEKRLSQNYTWEVNHAKPDGINFIITIIQVTILIIGLLILLIKKICRYVKIARKLYIQRKT